jgi:methionyl-tRNA synthetase
MSVDTTHTPFYITTTLPYVNARPHIGFAMEVIRADAIARYKRLKGHEVYFNTGTDEHGQKIAQKAEELGVEPQTYVDEMATHFQALQDILSLSADRFIRTTDKDHVAAAQAFWKMCDEKGYIYKKNYTGLYCVGCEIFLKEKDLVDGKCPDHPTQSPVEIEEENYFFAFSKLSDELKKKLSDESFVIPQYRAKEMVHMIEEGLEDFSISRLKEKVSWGVSVPGDDTQVMYVWFDALVNYISTLGWPEDGEKFTKFWADAETVQICGKDNTQHQSLRWQAMLMAAGLATTDHVIVNGFLTSDGQKMSKSLGNVIDPQDVVNEYGTDGLRYFVLRELHSHEDSDVTDEKIKEAYNANLANGIGNLTNRILKMAEDNLDTFPELKEVSLDDFPEYCAHFEKFDIQKAADVVWEKIGLLDAIIQEKEPFKLVKESPDVAKSIIVDLIAKLHEIRYLLQPLLPGTAEKLEKAIARGAKPEVPLFARK